MSQEEIPSAFVWTKMQGDAGENIAKIRNRKELERITGNGIFWWGIGESKLNKIKLLLQMQPRSVVLFSLMRGSPSAHSKSPGGVSLWQAYNTVSGQVPLPPHVIVTSSERTSGGKPKARYYALVCESESSILLNGGGTLDAATLRNIGGRGVGSSQITSVVERGRAEGRRFDYPITARASLVAPYAVTLSAPRELSPAEIRLLDEVGMVGKGRDDWLAVVKHLRRL